jgi:ribose-phosphate pyrophosphokinase
LQINEAVENDDIYVVQSMGFPANENIMELLITIDALKRASAAKIVAVLPYLAYGRQDKKTDKKPAIAAKLLANLILASGTNRIIALDIHTEQIQGYFDIPFDNLSGGSLFAQHISRRANIDDKLIIAPDVGSIARCRFVATKLGTKLVTIDKQRNENRNMPIMNLIGDVKDKDCIIVDDIVDSGRTLTEAAKVLEENGAKSVNAYVTHGVLSGDSIEKVNDSCIENLYLTNSINIAQKVETIEKIKIINIAPLFAQAIRHILVGGSVATLFN